MPGQDPAASAEGQPMTSTLVIVNDPRDWPLAIEGVEIVAASSYLTGERFAKPGNVRLFNLCRSYRYQSTGYYVSLLAAARGHKALPDITTIQDMKNQAVIRIAASDIEPVIQKSLATIRSKEFVLSIYFGRNLAKKYDLLCQPLFRLFQAPLLRAFFVYHDRSGKWLLQNITPIAARDIPDEHWEFVLEVARDFFARRRLTVRQKAKFSYDLAILVNPEEAEPPSNPKALLKFEKAAESLGFACERISQHDYGRLAEFDALFIRETTSVNHHTYRFARRAEAKKLVVVDDPASILKCTNKVFLAELLQKNRIPTPKTLILQRDRRTPGRKIAAELGLPCILKQPDSSFSQGVVKVDDHDGLDHWRKELFNSSDLIIAQEYMFTSFDWRVTLFDRQPLFVCKYFMAKKHWQIIKRDRQGKKTADGSSLTLPVEHAPSGLVKLAVKAANLVGDGLYGVDLKEIDGRFRVIEINDNPSIDAGVEDTVLKDGLYLRIMEVFRRRLEQMRK